MENDKLIFLEDYLKKTLENIIAIRVYNYILSENGKITIYYETYNTPSWEKKSKRVSLFELIVFIYTQSKYNIQNREYLNQFIEEEKEENLKFLRKNSIRKELEKQI